MERQEGVNYEGMEELEYAVLNLGMQRVLWELATIINSSKKDEVRARLRYGTQFNHDLNHNTADDRNDREKPFKMNDAS